MTCEVCGFNATACLCLSCPWCNHPTAWELTSTGSHCGACNRKDVVA